MWYFHTPRRARPIALENGDASRAFMPGFSFGRAGGQSCIKAFADRELFKLYI
jgi:hypothetical protein